MKHPAIDHEKSTNKVTKVISQRKQVELASEASEKKYSTIVEKGNDGIVIIQDGLVKFFNSMMSELTGYSREDGVGKPFINYISPVSRKLVFERYEKRLAGEDVPNRYELEIISKNGANIPVEISASIIDYEGKPADMAIIRDITERKRAEYEIRQRSEELAALMKVSQILAATLDMKTVFQKTTDSVTELMDLKSAAIYLLEGEWLYLWATTPPLDPMMPDEFCRVLLTDHPHIQETLSTRLPVLLHDTETENLTPAERAISEARGLRSILYLPLVVEMQAIGVLIVATVGEPRGITKAEIDMCRTLSHMAALYIQNARLYESVQHHAADLERQVAERKRTEKALEAALIKAEDEKNRTEAIISAIGDGIIIQDTDYKVIYQNQIQTELYGNHVGEDCYKAYGGCDTICEDCPVEVSFRDGRIHRLEKTIITGDRAKHFELTSSPLRDSSGKIIAGIKVVRDITEQKRLEETLRERESFLNSIFESIQDGIGVLDKDMTVIRVNATAEKWYPHRMPLVGKKCYEAYHGRKERCEVCPAWTSIQTKKTAHEIVPRHGPDGKAVGWMEIYSYPMIDAKTRELTGVIEYVRDITERKLAEEKLKLFSEAVETALDGIQIVDFDGRIIYSNRAVEEIYGYSRDEFTGKHVNDMNADPEIAEKFILPSIKETGRWVGELLVKHKDGSVFPVWLSTSLVMNDKGAPIAMVGIIKDMTERKETERKLNESHEFLQSIINGVAEPIMVIDKNYRVKLMNQAARGGLSEIPDNLCCYQISHHSNKPCVNSEHPCPLDEVRRTGRPITVVHEHFKVNGKKRFYEILASPLYDSDGALAGIIESSRDITERKLAEEALKKSEMAYRTLAENLPGIVYRIYLQENSRMRFFNKLAETVTGYTEKELSPGEICSIEDLIISEDRNSVIHQVKCATAENRTFIVEYRLRHKDGSIRYMLEHGTPIYENGEPLYIDGVIYDNTERKKSEEELRRSQASLESAQAQSKLGNWDFDPTTQICHWSKEMYHLLDIEPSIGPPPFQELLELVHPEDRQRFQDDYYEAFTSELPIKTEFRGNPARGLNRYYLGTVQSTRNDKGKVTKYLGTILDITKSKKAEDAIRKYASDLEESNKMKELFTDIMHHDLLNPLNTVGGFIEILKDEEDEPRKKKYLQTIERNLAKGVELIESATTLSRLESLQSIEFENIDIADVIGSNIENIRQEAEKAGIQIENRITQCMPVRANRIIEEVFSNLFSNAIKYASCGKKIIVDSKETDGFWRVNVVDFGEGVRDSEKTLIFERFRRLEKKGVKGSGLGLAIAKKIMELHNGRIWVEDNPDGGAVFVVEIRKNPSD